MKAKELENKSKEELKDLLKEERSKLVQMRFEMISKQLKNHASFKDVKKTIARIMTKINGSKK